MRNYMKERKYEKTPTTELLDFVAKKIDYTKDKERDKQTDYKDEIEHREPFADLKRKINHQDARITKLENAVRKLLKHKHSEDESVTIPIKDALDESRFF